MSYSIISARWGNTEQTSAVLQTSEAGAVAVSERDTPGEWQSFRTWAASNTVSPLPGPSATETRQAAFTADATRADLLTPLRTASLAQIDAYVDNKIASTNATTLRNEVRAAFKQVLKILALNVQK